MALTKQQCAALEVLVSAKKHRRPSEWVWPAAVSLKANSFDALVRRGLAEKRPCPHRGFSHDEYRAI